jgi:predicted dehydrogenase
MTHDNSKIWIFGCGYWSSILIEKIKSVFPDSTFFVIDVNEELLDLFLKKHEYCSKADLQIFNAQAKNNDLCFIVTPPRTHFDLVNLALDHSCHCWVEKPISMDSEQTKLLIDRATSLKKTLFIDNTFLFDPFIQNLKKNLMNERPLTVVSRRLAWGKILKDYGVLWDLLPHDLSIINNVFGRITNHKIDSLIYGPAQNFLSNTVLSANLRFQTANDIEVQVEISSISFQKIRQIQILNADKIITYDLIDSGSKLNVTGWNEIPGLTPNNQQCLSTDFYNHQDTITNAILEFKKLTRTGTLHDSIRYAIQEIELIQKLYSESKMIK